MKPLITLIVGLADLAALAQDRARVACVGDSIAFGAKLMAETVSAASSIK